jgi:DNA-binding transcriptional LysR family regulator
VELGSIQRAARAAGMSRSSLRRKLDNLEAEMGCDLFVRSSTGVVLTPAGLLVLEEGRAIVERFSRMVSTVGASGRAACGRVVLVVPVGMPDFVRVAQIQLLQTLAPELCLEELERPEPLDHLHEPFDLMLHFGEPPDRGRWFSRVIARRRLTALASEAYLAQHGHPTSVADLARHRLIGWHVGRSNPREWPLRAGGVLPVEPIFCSRSAQVVHRAAQEGIGILLGVCEPSMLPLPTRLIPLLESEIGGELTFRCLSPHPGDAEPRTRAVLEGIQAFLQNAATP